MARVTMILTDQTSGRYDGAVDVEWHFDPPLPPEDERTDAQLHADAIREFLAAVFGEIPGSQTQKTTRDVT